jgi:hypothetical protein
MTGDTPHAPAVDMTAFVLMLAFAARPRGTVR